MSLTGEYIGISVVMGTLFPTRVPANLLPEVPVSWIEDVREVL